MKSTTWHVIPSHAIRHVAADTHIFNGSEHNAHVEVFENGELHVKPLKSGQLVIQFRFEDSDEEVS